MGLTKLCRVCGGEGVNGSDKAMLPYVQGGGCWGKALLGSK